MGFVEDTFFGGAEKKAAKRQEAASKEAREEFREQIDLAVSDVEPFVNREGGLSLQKQQALSGALGPEAQSIAFQEFQESPNVAFLREQGLREIGSGAGAAGKLGGGDRLRELTKFSQGLALQDLQNQFNRLGVTTAGEENVTRRQQQAAETISGLRIGAAPTTAGLTQGIGNAQAQGLVSRAAGVRGGLGQVAGAVVGGLTGGVSGAAQGFFGV